MPLRVCIFGAGAIGGWLAGRLAEAGEHVSVVARGAHLAAIRAHGIIVEDPQRRVASQVTASDDPSELGEQDVVLVTVKAPALPAIAASIAPLLGRDTRVAFLTNGIPWWYFHGHGGALDGRRLPLLDPDDALWRAVGARTVGGIAWPASSIPEPGVIRLISVPSRGLLLGMPDGSLPADVARLADTLTASGVETTVSPQIRDPIWEKLAFNLSAGPMCVLTGAPVRATHVEPALVATSRRVLAEATALIAAMGRDVTLDVERIVAINTTLGHRPSILQDLQAGRPMEIDALYGVPLEMADMLGVAMPTLATLAGLIRVRAREAGLYHA
ncbi:MAG: 2-dehydropantoate 2-reductase [Acetobacteraceae bacterium]|nr:2-dehydropantoate 2-reductase [Acetobacteraceae bacterium]